MHQESMFNRDFSEKWWQQCQFRTTPRHPDKHRVHPSSTKYPAGRHLKYLASLENQCAPGLLHGWTIEYRATCRILSSGNGVSVIAKKGTAFPLNTSVIEIVGKLHAKDWNRANITVPTDTQEVYTVPTTRGLYIRISIGQCITINDNMKSEYTCHSYTSAGEKGAVVQVLSLPDVFP